VKTKTDGEIRFPTREEFAAYERVRRGGRFNVITEAGYAAYEAGLTHERYTAVLRCYGEAKRRYG